MARILTTLALVALALMTFFTGTASAQYFPPVPGFNQPLYPTPVMPVYPGPVQPAPIVRPNWTGGVDVINPERLTNPWANQAIPGTAQQFQRFDPSTGRFIEGTAFIGMDGKPHHNSTITNPDGSRINVVGMPAPGSHAPVGGKR